VPQGIVAIKSNQLVHIHASFLVIGWPYSSGSTASICDHMAVQTRRKAPLSVFNMRDRLAKGVEKASG